MIKKFKYKDVTWIDLESPTLEEIRGVATEYRLHPVSVSELENPNSRAKIDVFAEHIYLGLHFPRGLLGRGTTDNKYDSLEIDFIIGKNVIITNHYELVNVLNDFGKIFETDFILKKNHDRIHAGFIFYYIMREIYHALEAGLSGLNNRLRLAGGDIFAGHEREMVKTLANLNYELMDSRWSLRSHREVLLSLESAGEEFFGAKFKYYLQSIKGDHEKIWKTIESNHATFLDLRQTNDSLLSIKTNDITKSLTVIAFIFFPLTIISQTAALAYGLAFWPAIGVM